MFDYFINVQAIPIKFAVKIVWLKIYIIFSQSDDLALHSKSLSSQTWQVFNLYYTSHILDSIYKLSFKLGMTVDRWHICSCLFWWPWPWCKVIVGRQSQKFSVELSQLGRSLFLCDLDSGLQRERVRSLLHVMFMCVHACMRVCERVCTYNMPLFSIF